MKEIFKSSLFFLLITISIKSLGQDEFKSKQITVFKTGIALFEKEANVEVSNREAFFNKLPYSQEEVTTNAGPYGQKQNSSINIVLGSVSFTAENNNINEVRVQPNALKLTFNNDSRKQLVNLKYLQNGLMWIPNYDVKLEDNNKGTISLNAIILNNIEDFDNVNLKLAVGNPYFPYSNVKSPLAEPTRTNEMLNLLNHQSNNLSNYNSSFANETVVLGYGTVKKDNISNTNVSGQTHYEDLFFYSKNNFSLRKNEVAKISLVKFDINYKDYYNVEIGSSNKVISYNGINTNNKQKNTVWHYIKFTNSSQSPLTSGIAYFHKANANETKYIFQGQLKHTPSSELIKAKISTTPEIIVNDFDSIVNREEHNSQVFYRIQGEIEIVNKKNELVELQINREIIGELLTSETEWQSESLPIFNSKHNTANHVIWNLNLKAKESTTIKYSYKVTL